jgi:hypothetical protein
MQFVVRHLKDEWEGIAHFVDCFCDYDISVIRLNIDADVMFVNEDRMFELFEVDLLN